MKTKRIGLFAFCLMFALAAMGTYTIFASQSGVITGENKVINPVVSVIVPANLDFTLDPYELETNGEGQISPANYFFINKSEVPVKVSLSIEAIVNGGNLVHDPTELAKDDKSVTEKNIFMAVHKADSIDVGDLTFEHTEEHTALGIYNESFIPFDLETYNEDIIPLDSVTEDKILIPFKPETGRASVEFILQAALENEESGEADALAADGKGIGAFRFYAELNSYADWREGDVSVSASYEIVPVRVSSVDTDNEDINGEDKEQDDTALNEENGEDITILNETPEETPLTEEPLENPPTENQEEVILNEETEEILSAENSEDNSLNEESETVLPQKELVSDGQKELVP